MGNITVVPSEWVITYFFGFALFYWVDQKTSDLMVSVGITMLYLVSLTVGLKLYYGG